MTVVVFNCLLTNINKLCVALQIKDQSIWLLKFPVSLSTHILYTIIYLYFTDKDLLRNVGNRLLTS